MKTVLLLLFLTPSFFWSQSYRKFNESILELRNKKDSLFPIHSDFNFTKKGENDIYDWNAVAHLALTQLQEQLRKRDSLQISSFLTDLAQLCTETWKMSNYSDAKKWTSIHKHLNRAKRKFQLNFGILKPVAFRIPLLKDNKGRFYLDKKDDSSPYALYKGSKKDKKEEDEAIPLDFYTEKELSEQVVKLLLKGNLRSHFKAGNYSMIGLSITVDENSLRKNKIPSARVVILLGAKRLKLVK